MTDLSKPLPAGSSLQVYVVHKGCMENKETGDKTLADPVCTRLSEADAQSIADLLNDAQEGVFYLRFVASNYFPLAEGSGERVQEKASDPEILAQWNRIAAPLRRPLYQVTACLTKNQEDIDTFKKTIAQQEQDKTKK